MTALDALNHLAGLTCLIVLTVALWCANKQSERIMKQ